MASVRAQEGCLSVSPPTRPDEESRLIELLFSAAPRRRGRPLCGERAFRPKTRRRRRARRPVRSLSLRRPSVSIEPFNRPHPRIRTSLEEKQPRGRERERGSNEIFTSKCAGHDRRRRRRRRRPINAVFEAFGGSARTACLISGLAKGVVKERERLDTARATKASPARLIQGFTKRWALGCEKFVPCPAWLLLSETGPPFSASL